MTKNYRTSMEVSNLFEFFKIVGGSLFLVNFVVSEFWIEELLSFSTDSHQAPDAVIFSSIFFFFTGITAFFYNWLQFLIFQEAASG